jgi:hypothetical protein
MILGVRACTPLFATTPRTRQTHRTPEPCPRRSPPEPASHTSVSFTLDRYGGLFEGHDRELRDRLDAMFADASEGQVLALDRTASGPKVVPDSG